LGAGASAFVGTFSEESKLKPFKIPFSGRGHDYNEDDIATVVEVMKSSVTLTQGANRDQFETKFSAYVDSQSAFAVSSATSALELAATLCQLSAESEVVIPAHTFTSSAYPFARKGAKLVWADIDERTHVVTAEQIEEKLTNKTHVIVVPHLYGYGCDMPSIINLASERGLLVVEDAAQALGVEIEGKMAGTFGEYGIYSFHSHKNISTLGEGGMIVVNNQAQSKILPMLRHNGHCEFLFDRDDYWVPAMGNVDMPILDGQKVWPANFCLGEAQCALGARLLDRIDIINDEKRRRAISFIDALDDFPELSFVRENSRRHNYHLLVARVSGVSRDAFIRRMANTHQIQCVVQYCPLYRYPLYKKLDLGEADCPNTDAFFDNMVSFPFHHSLSEEKITDMLNAVKETLDVLRKHGQ